MLGYLAKHFYNVNIWEGKKTGHIKKMNRPTTK